MKFQFLISARENKTGRPIAGKVSAETVRDAFFLLCRRYGLREDECTLRASVQYDPENLTAAEK
jgi:hypothetical protein